MLLFLTAAVFLVFYVVTIFGILKKQLSIVKGVANVIGAWMVLTAVVYLLPPAYRQLQDRLPMYWTLSLVLALILIAAVIASRVTGRRKSH